MAFPYTILVVAFAAGIWTSVGPRRAAPISGALLVGYALVGLATGTVFRMNMREVLAAGAEDWRSTMHVPGRW